MPHTTDRQKVFLAIFLSAILGGSMGAMTKLGLQEIHPFTFSFARFLLAAIFFLPLFLRNKHHIRKENLSLLLYSLLGSCNITFFVLGVSKTTATISQLLYAAVPLLIGGISYYFLRQKLGQRKIVGIIVGFIGVSIVALAPVIEKQNAFSGNLLGNILISIGVIAWSVYMIVSKKLQKVYSPTLITGAFIFTTIIFLSPLFLYEVVTQPVRVVGLAGIVSVMYAGILGTVVNYVLYQYAIKHGGAVFASMAFYIQPLTGFIVGNLLLGEQLTWIIIIGGILALIGVYFVTKK